MDPKETEELNIDYILPSTEVLVKDLDGYEHNITFYAETSKESIVEKNPGFFTDLAFGYKSGSGISLFQISPKIADKRDVEEIKILHRIPLGNKDIIQALYVAGENLRRYHESKGGEKAPISSLQTKFTYFGKEYNLTYMPNTPNEPAYMYEQYLRRIKDRNYN